MNNFDSNPAIICKYEVLSEIILHSNAYKNVTLLCSRLLAKHRLQGSTSNCTYFEPKSLDSTVIKGQPSTNFENESQLKEENDLEDILNSRLNHCSQQVIVGSTGEENSSIEDRLMKLNMDESDHYIKWYEYWEEYGEDFVNETWIKLYGSLAVDDLSTNMDELYTMHREKQYQSLYWKYMNEMHAAGKEDHSNSENELPNFSEEFDYTSNFDFLYKYRYFPQLNCKLNKAYKALSKMGHIYDDQNIFYSAFVKYLKKHLIKSTRRLNVYRFPKIMKSANCNSETDSNFINTDLEDINYCNDSKLLKVLIQTKDNVIDNDIDGPCGSSSFNIQLKNNFKSRKTLKKEKRKEERDKHIAQELEQCGYGYLKNNPKLLKYWKRRHLLFTKFEKGILLDEESWYSVTPEVISSHIAERCSCYLIIDPFCGAGGNIIQLAMTCELVIAIDNDPKKIEIARHNAKLYGVDDRIQFIIGDFFALAPTLKADVIFLSPPWGGPDLMNLDEYKLSCMMPESGGGEHVMNLARQITSNIALHLPKNTNIFDCVKLADDGFVEVQQNILNSRYNSMTVYFSELYGLCSDSTSAYEENFEQRNLV